MILPTVMYHGKAPWPEPPSFGALIDVTAALRPAVEPYPVRFAYVLHDLSAISDDELREGAMWQLEGCTPSSRRLTIAISNTKRSFDALRSPPEAADPPSLGIGGGLKPLSGRSTFGVDGLQSTGTSCRRMLPPIRPRGCSPETRPFSGDSPLH